MSTLSEIGTWILFLGLPLLFLAIVAWVYRPGASRNYEADGRIPFSENGREEPSKHGKGNTA